MRPGRIACAVALLLLAGCAIPLPLVAPAQPPRPSVPSAPGEVSEAAPTPSAEATEPFPADVPAELQVANPRDARGLDICEFLTEAQLRELGLDPATARPDGVLRGVSCSWRYTDDSTRGGVGFSADPEAQKLPAIYRLRSGFTRFELLTVAGHPAIRADEMTQPGCTIYVAIADEQLLYTDGYVDGRVLPDQCAQSRRMAELVLSNLPPLR